MAFCFRFGQSRLRSLITQYRRCYVQIPFPNSSASSHRVTSPEEMPAWAFRNREIDFCRNVRFFAAPVQAKPKKEEKDTGGPRLNDQITARFVRLVGDNGHSVVSRFEALERAKRLKLDLVEVQRNADPPVCKIMDFHKEKYKQQVKEKDRVKSKSEVTLRSDSKEVRFSTKTELKDLKMKADMVRRFMERGYRVKCKVMGTEDQDLKEILSRLSNLIEEEAVVESGPILGRKEAYVIVRHVKFGPSKKGGGKKSKDSVNATSGVKKETVSPTANSYSPIINEDQVLEESDLETEEEVPAQKLVNGVPKPVFSSKYEGSYSRRQTEASDRAFETNSPCFTQEPSPAMSNRYRRTESRNQYQPSTSMNNRDPSNTGSGTREPVPLGPQFSSRFGQPTTDRNTPPFPGQFRTICSISRMLTFPPENGHFWRVRKPRDCQ